MMKTAVLLLCIILLNSYCNARAKKDFYLAVDSIQLLNVELDGSSMTSAWNDISQKYFIPSILITTFEPHPQVQSAPIRFDNITVHDLLAAVCEKFQFQFHQDLATGLIWIFPAGKELKILDLTILKNSKRGAELNLLNDVLLPEVRSGTIQVPPFVLGSVWSNTFNSSVSVESSSCNLREVLSDLCLSYLPISFCVDVRTSITVTPVNLSSHAAAPPRPGEWLFAEMMLGTSDPDLSYLARKLASDQVRVRDAAFQYYCARGTNSNFSEYLQLHPDMEPATFAAIAQNRFHSRVRDAGITSDSKYLVERAARDQDFARQYPRAHIAAIIEMVRLGDFSGLETVSSVENLEYDSFRSDVIRALRGRSVRELYSHIDFPHVSLLEKTVKRQSKLLQYFLRIGREAAATNTCR